MKEKSAMALRGSSHCGRTDFKRKTSYQSMIVHQAMYSDSYSFFEMEQFHNLSEIGKKGSYVEIGTTRHSLQSAVFAQMIGSRFHNYPCSG